MSDTAVLKKDIGVISALSIVVGVVLGAGAFMKPPAVLAAAGDPTWALFAWVIAALLNVAGGLTICELSVLYPRTGGIYVVLEEIYGPKLAYLYGWMMTIIYGPAVLGTLAGYFGDVFCLIFNISCHHIVGLAAIAFVVFVNSIGVKQAGYLQVVVTISKLIPVALLVVFGLWKGNGQAFNMSANIETSFSLAVLGACFAYDGWSQVASVAGEMKNPGKILPQAIIGGLLFLSVVYIGINAAMFMVLSTTQMVALGNNASSVAAQKLFGLFGGNLISVGILVSILGGLNGVTMTVSRTILAMAERNQLPASKTLGKINKDSKTPVNASLFLAILALIAMLSLDTNSLADMTVFASWIFYLFIFIAVFIARKRFPDTPRSYKVPLYPVTPIIAICSAIYILYGMISSQPLNAAASIVLLLVAIPFGWRKQ